MKEKLLISFSGGRTSAFMLKWILDNERDKYDIKVVFANTGKEDEETLSFINQCSIKWGVEVIWIESVPKSEKGWEVTFNVVDFKTASRNGEPFEAMIKKLGIPCSAAPFCSFQLKRNAILKYCSSIGWKKYFTAIGIRCDEIDRINPKHKELRIIYPLIKNNIYKFHVDDFWDRQDFKLNLNQPLGNCDVCWKKSDRKLIQIAQSYPEKFDWWQEMIVKYGDINTRTKKKTTFFRGAKYPIDFIKKAGYIKDQFSLFKFDDTPNGCSESCEVF